MDTFTPHHPGLSSPSRQCFSRINETTLTRWNASRLRPYGTHDSRVALTRKSGFTLIELLVVIVIIAITVSLFLLAWRPNTPDDALKEQSQKLKQLMQFAQEQAVIRGQQYGVRFYTDGYRFMKMEQDMGKWIWQDDKYLTQKQLPEGMKLELSLEDVDAKLIPLADEKMEDLKKDKDKQDPQKQKQSEDNAKVIKPQVFVLSSDEITPAFDVRLRISGVDSYYLLQAQINGQYKVTREQ